MTKLFYLPRQLTKSIASLISHFQRTQESVRLLGRWLKFDLSGQLDADRFISILETMQTKKHQTSAIPPTTKAVGFLGSFLMTDQRERIIELPLQTRDVSFSGVNKEQRLVHFSFSSNTPARRQWGWEILSHEPGCCDVSRIEQGACPFLKDHDWSKQAGKVLSVQLGRDKNYAVAKMFTSSLGSELMNEISEGRTEISCCYVVKSMKLAESTRDHEDDVYVVDKYEIIELSSVSIPMDTTVGVCRSMDNRIYECRVMTNRSGPITPDEENAIKEDVQREFFEEQERERVQAK